MSVAPGLDSELVETTRLFLKGKLSPADLEAWLAGVDYDDPDLSEDTKQAAALLRLLCIETGEGLRPAKELQQAARDLVSTTR